MGDRWQDAATRLRQARPPADLWGRIEDGPQLPPPPPAPRTRVLAAVAALGIFAIVGAVLWASIRPLGGNGGPLAAATVVDVPPRGDVSAIFLVGGRPVFVVHHEDGSVSVVDAFSSHRAWGIEELNVWCPSTREFVEVAHEARFDEYGNYASAGPAPTGLSAFDFTATASDDRGDPTSIAIGAMRGPSPGGSPSETDPSTYPPFCAGEDADAIVGHTVPQDSIIEARSSIGALAASGWIAVRGTLHVSSTGLVQLCPDVFGGRCGDGVAVRGVDGIGLLRNEMEGPDRTVYERPHVWLARVRDGIFEDIAILPDTSAR